MLYSEVPSLLAAMATPGDRPSSGSSQNEDDNFTNESKRLSSITKEEKTIDLSSKSEKETIYYAYYIKTTWEAVKFIGNLIELLELVKKFFEHYHR